MWPKKENKFLTLYFTVLTQDLHVLHRAEAGPRTGLGEVWSFIIIQTASFWKLLDLIRRGATTLPHRTCSSYRNVFPQWELHSPLPFVRNSVSVFCLYFLACVPHSRSPPTSPVFGEIFSDELYIVLALHIIFFSKLTQSWSLIQIQPFIPW